MKNYILTLIAFFVFSLPVLAGDKKEKKVIEKTVYDFVQGADDRDAERVSRAFHAEGKNYLIMKEKLMIIPQEQFVGLLKAGKIGGEKRKTKILSIDITSGNAAAAKVEAKGKLHFVYYLSLLKINGEWKIVNVTTGLK